MTDESSFFARSDCVYSTTICLSLYWKCAMPKSFSTFSRVFIGTFRLKRKWTRLCKRSAEWQMTLILYQSLYFAVRLSFRCCHNKTHLWSILLFLSVWLSPDECRRLWSVWHIVRYYFFLNGRGCFADLYSSLIQGDGGALRDRHLRRIRCPALVSAFYRQRR